MGHRANSDSIDMTACMDVLVENCFLRTWDDLVVVKTYRGVTQEARRIHVRKCVLYNEIAHALSIGAEITRDVEDVLFEDCDIIGDHGRKWTLRIYHTDAATVRNVRFENIRIEESVQMANRVILSRMKLSYNNMPFQLNNLAENPGYGEILKERRGQHGKWTIETGDWDT